MKRTTFSTRLFSRYSSVLMIWLAPGAIAGTHFVDATLATGVNDGSSWADAFQGPEGLQSAFAVATAGDEIWVADGVYTPTQTGQRNDSFRLLDDVAVYGGFNGTEQSVSERDLGATRSVLSGDLLGDDSGGAGNAENSLHVVRSLGVNSGAILDGFDVVGGFANETGTGDRGAGIICLGASSPWIRNCRFSGNSASLGGAAHLRNSTPKFIDCEFINNHADVRGGAIGMWDGSGPRLEGCKFVGNTAVEGGAVSSRSSSPAATNCLFMDNTATSVSSAGGGMRATDSLARVVNCTFVNNSAPNGIAGGLLAEGAASFAANCVFWENTGAGGQQLGVNQVDGASVTHSIVQGGALGMGNLSLDPAFANAAAGDYTLSEGSPGVDAGDNGMVPPGTLLDLGGGDRFIDDPLVADTGVGPGPLTDIGAFEKPALISTFCFGDGTAGVNCPCGNTGFVAAGCANSFFLSGAYLSTTGSGSVGNDSVLFDVQSSTPSTPGVFFQGDLLANGGAGVVLGDGLLCIAGPIIRMEVVFADASGLANSSVGVAAVGGAQVGSTKYYQWWYRDNLFGPCTGGSNLSNGVQILWIP